MEKLTSKQLYDFINSDEFTRKHLSVFVAALLDKEWTDYMENDLSLLGYDMTVDEFINWKIEQGLFSFDAHESILDENKFNTAEDVFLNGKFH